MRSKSKHLKVYDALPVATICLFFVILFTYALISTYSSDDYGYSLFLDNGFSGWMKMMREHYQTGNGRTFVHLLATAVLHFKTIVFAIVFIVNVIVIGFCFRSKTTDRTLFLILFLGGWVLMPRPVMVEGVLWVSGFCNYVFPVAMTALLFYQSKKALKQRSYDWKTIFVLSVLSFLTGATTEQNGMGACAVLAIIFFEALVNRNTSYAKICSVQILFVVMGIMTIFLSPATRLRVGDEMYEPMLERIVNSLAIQRELFSENYMFILLAAAFPILLLINADRKKENKSLISLSLLVELFLILTITTGGVVGAYYYGALMLLMLLLAVACWFSGYREIGAILCFGIITTCAILPTKSSGYRTLYSLYAVFLILVCDLFCNMSNGLIAKKGELARFIAVVVAVAATATAIHDFPHYYYNHKIDSINATYAKQAKSSGDLYYCMDYDKDYTHTKAYEGEYFYSKYMKTLRLPSPPKNIYFYSENLPVVYANNTRLTSPGIESVYGELMISLREVLEAVGGTVIWTKTKGTKISFNDKTYYLTGSDGDLYLSWRDENGKHNINMLTASKCQYYAVLLPVGFFQEILGLDVAVSEKEVRVNSQFD